MFAGLIALVTILIAINAVKNRHIVYSIVPVLTMLSFVLMRTWGQNANGIPWHYGPVLVMAFQAEYK